MSNWQIIGLGFAVVLVYLIYSFTSAAVERLRIKLKQVNPFDLKRVQISGDVEAHIAIDESIKGYRSRVDRIPGLMTKAERNYYWHLKPLAEKEGFVVFGKVRQADLVSVKAKIDGDSDGKLKFATMSKLMKRHIDFVLCDSKTMDVVGCIELNDSSHQRAERIKRDEEVRLYFAMAEIPLLEVICRRKYRAENTLAALKYMRSPEAYLEELARQDTPITPMTGSVDDDEEDFDDAAFYKEPEVALESKENVEPLQNSYLQANIQNEEFVHSPQLADIDQEYEEYARQAALEEQERNNQTKPKGLVINFK